MNKTEKEAAFMHGLTLEAEWTQRFTEVFDETVEIEDINTLTYINAGTGNHAIELDEKLGEDVEIFAVCETEELADTAKIKAEATNSTLDFSTNFPLAESDFVIADASLVSPDELDEFLKKVVHASSDSVTFFLPTAGSFGEIFSYLWEVLLDLDLLDKNADLEKLISYLPSVSHVEEIFEKLEIDEIETTTKNELYEYDNAQEFIESRLIQYYFMPQWFDFLSDDETEKVKENLAKKIDDDCDELTFRFTVKATVMGGKRK